MTSKTYLKVLLAAGVLAVAGGGAGTFASFTAETTNPNNTFATGTLLLHNTVNGGTACTSDSDLVDNKGPAGGCDVLFPNISLTDSTPAQWANLELKNAGTVDAGEIKFKPNPACTTGANNAAGPTFNGGGQLCAGLQFVIVETDATFNRTTGALGCAYGTAVGGGAGCSFDSLTGHTLGDLPASFTTLTLTPGTALASGASRYFAIGVKPATGALTNAFQNRKASFGLTWHIDQS